MDDDSEDFKQLDDLLQNDGDGIEGEIMDEDHSEELRHRHHDEGSGRISHDDHNHNDHFMDGILNHKMMAAKNDMGDLHSTSDSDTDHPLLGHDGRHNHQHQYHPPMSTPGQHFSHDHHESMMTNMATAAAFCKGMPMVMYVAIVSNIVIGLLVVVWPFFSPSLSLSLSLLCFDDRMPI